MQFEQFNSTQSLGTSHATPACPSTTPTSSRYLLIHTINMTCYHIPSQNALSIYHTNIPYQTTLPIFPVNTPYHFQSNFSTNSFNVSHLQLLRWPFHQDGNCCRILRVVRIITMLAPTKHNGRCPRRQVILVRSYQ